LCAINVIWMINSRCQDIYSILERNEVHTAIWSEILKARDHLVGEWKDNIKFCI